MDNIIRIPTAEQARDAVSKQADIECERIWENILRAVKNAIYTAIESYKCSAYLSESAMCGVATRAVFQKLRPMLTSMGYKVEMGRYSGITISWEEGVTNESQ